MHGLGFFIFVFMQIYFFPRINKTFIHSFIHSYIANPLVSADAKDRSVEPDADSWFLSTNCLSVFDRFVGLALKGLKILTE